MKRRRKKRFLRIFAGVWAVFLLASALVVACMDPIIYKECQSETSGATAESLEQEIYGYMKDLDLTAAREYAKNGFTGKEKLSKKEELVLKKFAVVFNAMGTAGRYMVIWDEDGKELYHTGESVYLSYGEGASKQEKKAVCTEKEVVSFLKDKKKFEKECISAYINGTSFYPDKVILTNPETGEREEINVPLQGINLDGYQKVENLEDTFFYIAAGEERYRSKLVGEGSWEERARDTEYLSMLRKYKKKGFEQDPIFRERIANCIRGEEDEEYWKNKKAKEDPEYEPITGCTYRLHNGINEEEVLGAYYVYNEAGEMFHVLVGEKFETFTLCRPLIIISWIMGFFVSVVLALIVAWYFYRIYKKEIAMQKQQRVFSNSLAHELKTPLMAISGYTDNIIEHVQPDKEKEYLHGTQENVRYMNNLIEAVITLAKVEHGEQGEKKKLSLHEIFLQKENLYTEMLAEKQLTIKCSGKADILGDFYLTDQLVTNLLDNAVRYAIPETQIEISCSPKEFSIANRAEKMTEEQIKDMQKPFSKGEISRTRREKGGHGLGLSIVQEILDICGWKGKMQYADGKVIVSVKMK